jgi:hypothetical protein
LLGWGAGSSGNTLHGFVANMHSFVDSTDTYSYFNGLGTDGITGLGASSYTARPHGGSGDYASFWHSTMVLTNAGNGTGVTGVGAWHTNTAGGSTVSNCVPSYAGFYTTSTMGATYSGASGDRLTVNTNTWY